MGTDLSVVNSARVSFDKESYWDYEHYDEGGYGKLKEKDQRLISYLAKHNHFTPFTHVQITMRETVPIFVARQRFKHTVGWSYNEVSRRYVDDEPVFYVPDDWRGRSEDKKQGSSGILDEGSNAYAHSPYTVALDTSLKAYKELLRIGVAPEQARMVLPQSMYTSYYVTGSLYAWANAYKLRSSEDAQKEIRDLADQWNTIIGGIKELEHSWTALTSKS